MVHGKFAVEHFLEVLADVAQSQVQALQRLELRSYSGGKSSDGDIPDVPKKMFHTNFLCFFGLDYGRGVDKGPGRCCAILLHQEI